MVDDILSVCCLVLRKLSLQFIYYQCQRILCMCLNSFKHLLSCYLSLCFGQPLIMRSDHNYLNFQSIENISEQKDIRSKLKQIPWNNQRQQWMEPEKKNPSFVTSKGNQIWTVSLYLAWQQFQKQSKFNVQIPENATTAKNMVQTLRSLKCSPNQVDNGVYYRAGAGNAIITTINSDLEERFQKQDAEKMERIKHDQVVFYGAVIEKLQMKYPFQIIPGKIMHFCKVKVPCFEPLTANQRSQVFIVNYTNQDNFLIRIELADKGHQFFALMTKHKLNLEQVFERIRISDDEGEPMTNYDTFKIPQLKIKASHVMTDLSCTRLKFPGDNKKYEVSQLVQNVTLEMIGKDQEDDMSGLTLSVPESENPKLKRRRLCLNNPFWVVLRIKGFRPYFGMYVNKAIDMP